MSNDCISAIADSITALAAVLALGFAWVQVREAANARDLQFLNNQRELLGTHWRNARAAYQSSLVDGKFEFGELLDCYERTCFALNRLQFGSKTYNFFRDHILEVILNITDDPFMSSEMKALRSGPSTYSEMQKFIDKNKVRIDEIRQARKPPA